MTDSAPVTPQAAEWHRYLHAEGVLVPDEGEDCGPWHHRVFMDGPATPSTDSSEEES